MPLTDNHFADFGHQISLLAQVSGGSIIPHIEYDGGDDFLQVTIKMPSIPAVLFFCDQEPGWIHLGVRRTREGKKINQVVASLESTDKSHRFPLSIAYRDGGMQVKIHYQSY